jgi:hypothetical protein
MLAREVFKPETLILKYTSFLPRLVQAPQTNVNCKQGNNDNDIPLDFAAHCRVHGSPELLGCPGSHT